MATDDEILQELRQIRRLLSTLSFQQRKDLRAAVVEQAGMSTPQREKMFALMDGTRSNAEIATAVGVSDQAVRYFCEQLEKAGFITWREQGRAKCPESLVAI